MIARRLRPMLPLMPLLLLAACASAPARRAQAVLDPPPAATPAKAEPRKADIRRQLRVICPGALKPETLETLAAAVEDKPSRFAAVSDVDRQDREAAVCRGDAK